MSSKTKSGETSTGKIRMVHAILLETPQPSQIQRRFWFFHFKLYFHYLCCPIGQSLALSGCLKVLHWLRIVPSR